MQVPGLRKTELLVCKAETCFIIWNLRDTGVVFALGGKSQSSHDGVGTPVGGGESLAGTGGEYS